MNEELDPSGSGADVATPVDLLDVVDDLKLAFLVPPDEVTTRRHLARLTSSDVATPTPAARPARSRRRGRILVPLCVSGGLVLATGGLAAAGVLPAPVQHAVAAIASPFGVHVPSDSTSHESDETNDDGTDHDGPDQTTVAPTSTVAPAPGPAGPSTGDPSQQAPGQGGQNPGKSDEAPGQQTDPGASGSAPGHGGENPGKSDQAPGRQTEQTTPQPPAVAGGTNPGKSGRSG